MQWCLVRQGSSVQNLRSDLQDTHSNQYYAGMATDIKGEVAFQMFLRNQPAKNILSWGLEALKSSELFCLI